MRCCRECSVCSRCAAWAFKDAMPAPEAVSAAIGAGGASGAPHAGRPDPALAEPGKPVAWNQCRHPRPPPRPLAVLKTPGVPAPPQYPVPRPVSGPTPNGPVRSPRGIVVPPFVARSPRPPATVSSVSLTIAPCGLAEQSGLIPSDGFPDGALRQSGVDLHPGGLERPVRVGAAVACRRCLHSLGYFGRAAWIHAPCPVRLASRLSSAQTMPVSVYKAANAAACSNRGSTAVSNSILFQ
jgi:hypothetical protein